MKRAQPRPDKDLGDDRNLVSVSNQDVDADFEEGILLFWQRHRNTIVTGVVVVIVLVGAFELWSYLDERRETSIRNAFQGADSPSALLSFAESYPDHSLAGFAYLQVANSEYREKAFESAASHYHDAIAILADTPLSERARLGYAMSSIAQGQRDIGESVLDELAADNTILDTTRAEAAYNLAVLYAEMGDRDSVLEQIDFIGALEQPGYWLNKTDFLRETIPGLEEGRDPVVE